MKPLHHLLSAGLALVLLSTSAHAITYPVFADTAGSPATGLLSKSAGVATSLPVSSKSNTYIAFGMTGGLNVPSASSVTAARLIIYFQKVTKPGNLTVFVAGANELGQFSEIFPVGTTTQHLPAAGAPIAVNPTFGVGPFLNKNFFFIDVTAEVKSWLNNPGTEFGFGIAGDNTVSALLGSKEGSGTGYPAVLEVDVNPSGGTVTGTNAFLGTVGIGTSTPGSALQVGDFNTPGVDNFMTVASGGVNDTNPPADRLSGINLSNFNNTFGFTIQSRDGVNSAGLEIINNGSGTTGVPAIFVARATGNVGIGTTSPNQKLVVSGSLKAGTGDNAAFGVDSGVVGHMGIIKKAGANPMIASAAGFPIIFGQTDQGNIFNNIGTATLTETMRIASGGNVGIGTNNPTQAKLVVNGNVGTAVGAFGNGRYINNSVDLANVPWNGGAVSIYASDNVVCSGVHHFSDARIKQSLGRSNSATDLATLRGIEITDYTHKDVIGKGSGAQKKLIAQQVEKVYPEAVSKNTGVVPDIYQKANINEGWVNLATDLKVGERVRLIGEKEEGIHEVIEVREGGFRTAFQSPGGTIFVFGREVNDFREVDYDAIAMLNVSATQELARKLEAKDAEIATLKAANLALAAKMAAFDEKLTALKTSLDDRPARTVRAALDLK